MLANKIALMMIEQPIMYAMSNINSKHIRLMYHFMYPAALSFSGGQFLYIFRSKLFLNEIWKDPCIDLDRVNPIAYHHLDELRKLLPLRTKLSLVYPYISTCRKSPTQELVSM